MPSRKIPDRLVIYIRDRHTCVYCGIRCEDKRGDMSGDTRIFITIDHLIPHSQRRNNTLSNLFVACNQCNSTRRNLPLREYCTRYGKNWLHVYHRIQQRRRRNRKIYALHTHNTT